MNRSLTSVHVIGLAGLAAWFAFEAAAQTTQTAPTPTPPQAAPRPKSAPTSLDQLAWLRGCWAGKVSKFDFVETWLAPRGGMMVGINHTIVSEGNLSKTQEYQYLRLEERTDGVYYVAIPSGKEEATFKLASVGEELGHMAYTFNNKLDEFPQQIVYMRGKQGWLYAKVSGKTGNQAHPTEVTYPMRHVDCTTGANITE
jgi:hypothetical protein